MLRQPAAASDRPAFKIDRPVIERGSQQGRWGAALVRLSRCPPAAAAAESGLSRGLVSLDLLMSWGLLAYA
jgi:hypothetical protein